MAIFWICYILQTSTFGNIIDTVQSKAPSVKKFYKLTGFHLLETTKNQFKVLKYFVYKKY